MCLFICATDLGASCANEGDDDVVVVVADGTDEQSDDSAKKVVEVERLQ